MSESNAPEFSLDKQSGKLKNINLREEKHGDEDIVACDLTFIVPISNMQLAEFHPMMRHAFYYNKDVPQADLVDREPTNIKFPQMGAFKWELSMEPCAFVIHWGITPVELLGAKVGKFVLEPREGGTVDVKFQVQALPTPEVVGRLSGLMGKSLELSLAKIVEPEKPEGEF